MFNGIRNLLRQLRFSAPNSAFEPPLLYSDERSCALAIITTELVKGRFTSLGVDPKVVEARLQDLEPTTENPSLSSVLTQGSFWHMDMARLSPPVPLELLLLVGLQVQGGAEIKRILTQPDGQPGDIPFFVAHKKWETELRALWPQVEDQTGDVLLFNDSFTPMEKVVGALETSFALSPESATKKMLEVHVSGASVLKPMAHSTATETCIKLNAEWRATGLPLYCAPQSKTPIPAIA